MSHHHRALLLWWGLAIVLGAAAPFGPTPAMAGLALGLFVGSVYVWLLERRMHAVEQLTPERAAAAAQVGGATRLAFVLVAFLVAARLWPHSAGQGMVWALLTFFVPLGAWTIRRLREVNG